MSDRLNEQSGNRSKSKKQLVRKCVAGLIEQVPLKKEVNNETTDPCFERTNSSQRIEML